MRAMRDARAGAGFDDPALAQAFSRRASAGVFSAAQALAGQAVYQRACAACHGADFQGAGGVPPVAGAGFLGKWRGKSVGELFAYIRDMMPVGAGRSLPDAEYLAAAAYVLEANHFPAGADPLDPDEAILRNIGIE